MAKNNLNQIQNVDAAFLATLQIELDPTSPLYSPHNVDTVNDKKSTVYLEEAMERDGYSREATIVFVTKPDGAKVIKSGNRRTMAVTRLLAAGKKVDGPFPVMEVPFTEDAAKQVFSSNVTGSFDPWTASEMVKHQVEVLNWTPDEVSVRNAFTINGRVPSAKTVSDLLSLNRAVRKLTVAEYPEKKEESAEYTAKRKAAEADKQQKAIAGFKTGDLNWKSFIEAVSTGKTQSVAAALRTSAEKEASRLKRVAGEKTDETEDAENDSKTLASKFIGHDKLPALADWLRSDSIQELLADADASVVAPQIIDIVLGTMSKKQFQEYLKENAG